MELKEYLIEHILGNKELIEELLKIDNSVQYTNLTYEELLETLKKISNHDMVADNSDFIALTDGELNTVIKVLFSTPNLSTLYVNRAYLGINNYLVQLVNQFNENNFIKLDKSLDYHKYKDYQGTVILSGFDTFVEALAQEFDKAKIIIL